jgi:hypothetical protein
VHAGRKYALKKNNVWTLGKQKWFVFLNDAFLKTVALYIPSEKAVPLPPCRRQGKEEI